MKDKITVVTVDDHAFMSEAIRTKLLENDKIDLVAQGQVGDDVLPLVEQHQPDVLILDLSMPQSRQPGSAKFSPMVTIAHLTKTYPDLGIIIFTQYFLPAIIKDVVKKGVRGYLLKDDALSLELPASVVTVSQGGVAFSKAVTEALFKPTQFGRAGIQLTERQIAALTCIATDPDATYETHARSLGISEGTFKSHLTKAFNALDVSSSTAAVLRCIRLGIIPLDFE